MSEDGDDHFTMKLMLATKTRHAFERNASNVCLRTTTLKKVCAWECVSVYTPRSDGLEPIVNSTIKNNSTLTDFCHSNDSLGACSLHFVQDVRWDIRRSCGGGRHDCDDAESHQEDLVEGDHVHDDHCSTSESEL